MVRSGTQIRIGDLGSYGFNSTARTRAAQGGIALAMAERSLELGMEGGREREWEQG